MCEYAPALVYTKVLVRMYTRVDQARKTEKGPKRRRNVYTYARRSSKIRRLVHTRGDVHSTLCILALHLRSCFSCFARKVDSSISYTTDAATRLSVYFTFIVPFDKWSYGTARFVCRARGGW